MHCGHAHVDQLLGHPCLFRRPQASGLRLRQYHLAAQRPLRSLPRVRAISREDRNNSHRREQPVGERDFRHAPQPRSWPIEPDTPERLSFGQQILRFLKQVGLAALFLLFGFGRVLSARARSAQPQVPHLYVQLSLKPLTHLLTFPTVSQVFQTLHQWCTL